MASIKLSVIFPNLDGNQEDLKALFNSIKNSSFPRSKLEVILVDNSLTNNSIQFMKQDFPWVKIISLKHNYGFAKAINIGIKKASGQYIFITNNDVELEKNCLETLVNYLSDHPDTGIIGCRVNDYFIRTKLMCSALNYHRYTGRFSLKDRPNQIQEADWVAGAGMCFSKKIWTSLKGFDEQFFFTGEELDFCLRIKQIGLKVVYNPKAILWHKGGETINRKENSYFKQLFLYRGIFRNILKHSSPVQIFTSFLVQLAVLPFHKLFFVKGFNYKYILQALKWNLQHPPKRSLL